MSRCRWRWVFVVAAVVAAGRAGAQEGLRPTLKQISKAVAGVAAKEEQTVVALGPFTGRYVPASAGAGIKKILAEELAALGITINPRAKLHVSGEYIPLAGPDAALREESKEVFGLRLNVTIKDSLGKELVSITSDVRKALEQTVEDKEVVAQVLGVTRPDEGGSRTEERQGKDLKKRLDEPKVSVAGARVKAAPEGKYAIEVHVQRDGKFVPLTASDEDGFAFVGLKQTDVFAINLINDSDYEAAVELTVDGLSNFAFFHKKGYRHLIVPPRSSYLAKGWLRDLQTSDEFIITDYAKGAVKELGASPDGIGTITVSFAAAWDPRYDANDPEKSKLARRPPDDQSQPRDISNPAAGRGKAVATPVVELPREIGRVRDIISVRYKRPEAK